MNFLVSKRTTDAALPRWPVAALRKLDNPALTLELTRLARHGTGLRVGAASGCGVAALSVLFGLFTQPYATADEVGKLLFQVQMSFYFVAYVSLVPAAAAALVAGDRQSGVWMLLQRTSLSPRQLVWAKLGRVSVVCSGVVICLVPATLFATLFGGISIREAVFGLGLLMAWTPALAGFGLHQGLGQSTRMSAWLATLPVSFGAAVVLLLGVGVAAANVLHGYFPQVPANAPAWLPVALAQEDISPAFTLAFVLSPLSLVVLTTWLSTERAVLRAAGATASPRSLRAWVIVATPTLALLIVSYGWFVPRDAVWILVCLTCLILNAQALLACCCAAAEPAKPPAQSSYSPTHWLNRRDPWVSSLLSTGVNAGVLGCLVLGTWIVELKLNTTQHFARHAPLQTVVYAAMYCASFAALCAGLVALLRSRGFSTRATRAWLLLVCVSLTVLPWVYGLWSSLAQSRVALPKSAALSPLYLALVVKDATRDPFAAPVVAGEEVWGIVVLAGAALALWIGVVLTLRTSSK